MRYPNEFHLDAMLDWRVVGVVILSSAEPLPRSLANAVKSVWENSKVGQRLRECQLLGKGGLITTVFLLLE
jgi:hypothetical protein